MLKQKNQVHSSNDNKCKTTFRFFKNKNIVQSNKQNYETNRPTYFNPRITKNNFIAKQFIQEGNLNPVDKPVQNPNIHQRISCKDELSIKKQPNAKSMLRSYRSTDRTNDCTIGRHSLVQQQRIRKQQKQKHFYQQQIFKPKIKNEIVKRYNQYRNTHNSNRLSIDTEVNNVFYEDKVNLQKLLVKNKLYGNRCLVGLNIPKIQQKHQFSRFELFNLYTYYKTLLSYSKKSPAEFKKGFQSILYINKIQLNSQMISSCFQQFFTDITFSNFIKIYGNIQNLLFTQTIIQFMLHIFGDYYRQEWFNWEKTLEIIKEKMEENQSMEIRKILFDYFGRKDTDMIQMKEILKACHDSIAICRNIFNTMSKLGILVNKK